MSRAALLVLLVLPVFAQDARQIVEESQKRGRANSQRYEGVLEVIGGNSKVAKKSWQTMRIGSYGNSKAIIRFTAPAEVKGVALLIVNHPDRASDQWMWTPAIGRDRRIALQDRSTRFFGTDFSFEDLEERDVNQYEYVLLGDDTVDGVACWKIQSQPKEAKSSQYTRSIVWVRKDNYAFARIEFPGRKLLFGLFLSVLLVPTQLLVIPQYQIMQDLGLLNTLPALFLPGMFSAFGTFLLRQFFLTIPIELEEAAKIDGAGHIRILQSVIIPISAPAFAVLDLPSASAWIQATGNQA